MKFDVTEEKKMLRLRVNGLFKTKLFKKTIKASEK